MLKRYVHNSPHLLVDEQAYFITASVYERRMLLKADSAKEYLLETLYDFASRVGWRVDNWVILDNHYHCTLFSKEGADLPYIIGNTHRKSAKEIRRVAGFTGKTVWWNYHDYCLRNERDYFVHLNYMLYNPIKHGYVADLKNYPWSSFHLLFEELGRGRLVEQFRAYPYSDLELAEDYF